MKLKHKLKPIILLLLPLLTIGVTRAAPIDIPLVTVGVTNNANDPVAYSYQMGKYEVTSGQYAAFLNAVAQSDPYGLYDGSMSGGYGCGIIRSGTSGNYTYAAATPNLPVNHVNFFDAARFVNWLTSGDTESGMYDLSVLDGLKYTDKVPVVRNEEAWLAGGFAIANTDEWFKAGYYDPTLNGGEGGFWTYPTQSNTITTDDANYGMSVGHMTEVGIYDNPSYYGTYDQAGNAMEWTETITSSGSSHYLLGGDYSRPGTLHLGSGATGSPWAGGDFTGIRIVTIAPVPEPSTYAAIAGALALIFAAYRRRKK